MFGVGLCPLILKAVIQLTQLRATGMVLAWEDKDESPTSTSVGELVPNLEAKIMDEEGFREIPAGGIGELWFRGPNIMKGYWRNAKATQETITSDGWLKTGDIASVDKNGKFFITDRKKVCLLASVVTKLT